MKGFTEFAAADWAETVVDRMIDEVAVSAVVAELRSGLFRACT